MLLRIGKNSYPLTETFDISPAVNYSEIDSAYRIAIGIPDKAISRQYEQIAADIGKNLIVNCMITDHKHTLNLYDAHPIVTVYPFGTFIEFETPKVSFHKIDTDERSKLIGDDIC